MILKIKIQSWSQDLITSLEKFKNFFIHKGSYSFLFFCLIFCSFFPQIFAQEFFELSQGQKISILSDKAFRKSEGKEFEAVGNVVVTHLTSTIYGEKAYVNFEKGETIVEGNVRYVAPEVNMFGSKLHYNILSKTVDLYNARIQTGNFAVIGKKITQIKKDLIYAEDAEYSTCKDCPESWSIFGKNVEITVGEYVKLTNAFVKVNGVVVMYIPYVIFPIKKERETGFLFPKFGIDGTRDFRFQQPFFWAITDYNDLTLTPSVFGKRGFGNEFQFRQSLGPRSWFEINSVQVDDKIYAPYKLDTNPNKKSKFRDFSSFEGHFELGKNLNSHLSYDRMQDLDSVRDLDFFSESRVRGSEAGLGGFLDYRNQYFNISSKAGFNRNFFVDEPYEFDEKYVQLLPRINLSTVPFNLFSSDYFFFKRLNLVWNSDVSIFKQNKSDNSNFIRNAKRLNLNPYLDWQLGQVKGLKFSSKIQMDDQYYWLGVENADRRFSKKGIVYETEARIEFEKIFGIAHSKDVSVDEVKQSPDKDMIGFLPTSKNDIEGTAKTSVAVNSYRHSQEFKLKHYYLEDQKQSGNQNFRNQILKDAGQFDYVDALREKEYENNQVSARDSLPVSNTIEFQWNNILIKKSPKKFNPMDDWRYLKDNFEYSKIAFFDVSQGIDLNYQKTNEETKLSDKLTRLYVNTGFSINSYNFALKEFYFHQTSEHKLTLSLSKDFNFLTLGGEFTYNSFNASTTPVQKTLVTNTGLRLSDIVYLKVKNDYDIVSKKFYKSIYGIDYSPLNNCWKLLLNYETNLYEKKFSFNFLLNYNNNSFQGITDY